VTCHCKWAEANYKTLAIKDSTRKIYIMYYIQYTYYIIYMLYMYELYIYVNIYV